MNEQTFILKVYSADMLTDRIRNRVLELCETLQRDHHQTEIVSLHVAQDLDHFRPML